MLFKAPILACVLLLASSGAAQEDDTLHIPLTRRDPGFKRSDGSAHLPAIFDQATRTTLKYYRNAKHLNHNRGIKPSHQRILRSRALLSLRIDSYCVWSGKVYVGTPPQEFNIFFDSGSTDFTLPAAECTQDNCGSKARYNYLNSTTAANTGTDILSNFADGTSSKGVHFKDVVTVSGLTTTQSIIAASQLSSTIKGLDSDGLMGMAYSSLSATNENSFPFSLNKLTPRKANAFAIRLSDNDGESEVSIGSWNGKKVGSKIAWYNVGPSAGQKVKSYWQITGSSPTVNGKQAISKRASHIIDSGTTFIIAPPAGAAEFYASIPGSAKLDDNHWTYPCDNPPVIAFTFGTNKNAQQHSINPDDFNLGYLTEDESRCVGAVISQDLGLGTSWILGATFLKSWYSIFDMTNGLIGFATPK